MMSQQSNPFRGERSDEKRASASDGLGKGEKEREEVKLESPPMSSVTSAGSDACDGKKKTSALAEKKDFIHVRARRGQATDSHSLAERVRREKISQRMKVLQDLVPGCSKISGKASMLDEIINYVQSLQRQVEFLSMKLAAVSPTVHFGNGDALFTKQIVPISGIEASPHLTAMALSSAAPLSESWPFLEMNPPAYPWEADLHAICGAELQPNREGLLLPPAFLGTVELSEISPDCHQRLRERKPLN